MATDHLVTGVGIDLRDTPVVTIELQIVEANIRKMQQFLNHHGVACRPHIKTHKSPAIARMQIAAGAAGISCQKLGEVSVMLEAGITDILLCFNIVGAAKLERLRALGTQGRISVVCDSLDVAKGLSKAFHDSKEPLRVLVECDTGAGRNGVQTPDAATSLARQIQHLPGLVFGGLMTYPIASGTVDFFATAHERLEALGLRCPTVSTGGTVAHPLVSSVPGVTEHRPGVYVFNDGGSVSGGVATWDDCAMRVRTTVISRPTNDRAIIDAGSKTLTSDRLPAYAQPASNGHGRIMEYPQAILYRLDEEHGYLDLSACTQRPEFGELISVVPNHACVVTNLHDQLIGIRGGRVESVLPVVARGTVR